MSTNINSLLVVQEENSQLHIDKIFIKSTLQRKRQCTSSVSLRIYTRRSLIFYPGAGAYSTG